MKILHFSDLHLGMENYGHLDPETGLSTRYSDWQKTMSTIVDYANEYDVDLVIFSGDAFKNRDPSPTYQNAFARFIKRLSEPNRHVVLLVGNHDLPNIEHKAHTLEIYNSLNLPRVLVSKKMERFSVETKAGKIQLVTWPWLTRNFLLKNEDYRGKSIEEIDTILLSKAAQLFTQLIDELDTNLPSIAIVHATVMGAQFGSERNVMIGKDLVIPGSILQHSKLSYVACGHLHKHQIVGTDPLVAYAGSPERIDFGEEKEDKGCILVTLDESFRASIKFLQTPAREFFTWKITDPFGPPGKNLKEKVIKITISGNREFVQSITLETLEPYIRDAYYFAGIERNIEESKESLSTKINNYHSEAINPEEQLAKYLAERGTAIPILEKAVLEAKKIFSSTEDS